MGDLPLYVRLPPLIIMLLVFLYLFGPYLWERTKIWLLSCPIIDHLSGCDCAACRANAPRIVNGEWLEDDDE